MTTDSGLSHEFQGRVAIHNNGAGDVPGTKLCDLQGLSDYETGLSLSNGDWPDRLYAPEYAAVTLAASTTYWVLAAPPQWLRRAGTENNRRVEESGLPRAELARRRGLNRHTIRRWNAGAPPNGRHMMHMTALLEMADTLRPGHLLTTRDGWQEARCGTPDSTGNNGVPETVYRGGRQPSSCKSGLRRARSDGIRGESSHAVQQEEFSHHPREGAYSPCRPRGHVRDRGAVPNLRLSSAAPGELTISWDAPDPAPSDYRVIWAEQSLGFLSYKNSNEAGRGNEYPSGEKRSITLTGLTKGETFKVMARARYTSGGRNNGPWSGPWTDTVTARVKDDPPAAPTGLTASQVAHDSVTLAWTAPSRGTVTGYRVLRGTDANSLSAIAQDTGNAGAEYTDSTVAAETTYHYAVLALSQNGDGAQSAAVSATTPAAPRSEKEEDKPPPNIVTRAAPGVPLNLTAVAGDTKLTFSWDPPASDGGSAIVRYNYEFGPTGGTLVDENHGTDPTGSQTLRKTGLINGTGYTFKLRAVNRSGGSVTTGAYVTVTGTPQANSPATAPMGIVGPIRVPGTVSWDFNRPEDSDGIAQSGEAFFSLMGGYEFQWLRVDVATETAITGATSHEYTLTSADVGKKLKLIPIRRDAAI